jgi:hypothetical protein
MGQNLVDNGLSGPTSFVTIPENLRIVITKMMPEITRMCVARVEAYKKYNPENFDVIDEYIVKLRLTFDGGIRTLNGSDAYYGEEINKLFHFTYPDYDFVKFLLSLCRKLQLQCSIPAPFQIQCKGNKLWTNEVMVQDNLDQL